ncbi:putative ribosomal protein L21 [Medicago truncatula]|uniref:50S ribosomal protein L21 n=1 Tax=Medicago truncatula TaxID=3880 RepID=A0A072VPH5_MEDTR|nr:50S ribosomal protein L21, chloroplastic [Medicago truncatula]KEH43561.1 50S ribosomal protein L21 [Medicago truncatula]RHN81568.1 putative ribosomal protein L21 [Medicago truncatula]
MASATASTLSTLCSSFTTHCSIKPHFSISHQPFSSRFPSHNLSFQSTFSQRLPLLPAPKSTESSVAPVDSDSQVSESESSQIVQSPSWEKGLFAVVMIGGRQYIVHPGRWLVVQRLKGANVNDKIALHKVLLVGTDTSCYIGKPVVTNAVVYATVEEQGLDNKVIVFKYKRKKKYRRTIGHRQPNTRIRINSIMGYEDYPKVTMDDINLESS